MALKIKPKFRINTKILLTLLGLSLLPLILFILIFRLNMTSLESKVRSELITEAKGELARLAMDQAAISNAMLAKIMVETQTMAQFASVLWSNPSCFGYKRSYSAEEEPDDRYSASVCTLAPDVFFDKMEEELNLSSNMDDVFMTVLNNDTVLVFSIDDPNIQSDLDNDSISRGLRQEFGKNGILLSNNATVMIDEKGSEWLIADKQIYVIRKDGDKLDVYDPPDLDSVYIGTQSGIFREYPWNSTDDPLHFSLELEFQSDLNSGKFSEELRQEFENSKIRLSPNVIVSTKEKGNEWLIIDKGKEQIYSVKKERGKLNIYSGYDPRTRPWYTRSVDKGEVVWTKYANWTEEGLLFSIGLEYESHLHSNVVSDGLWQEFRGKSIPLSKNATVSTEKDCTWQIIDENNNKHYAIIKEEGELNVYNMDILTCSKSVRDSEGKLVGVIGADITLETISKRIIRTPEEIEGYAFLTNEDGKLIEQEINDMFIPNERSDIRKNMTAGETGIEFDKDSKTYIAYAPIPSIKSSDAKSSWSIGMVMSEQEMTKIIAKPVKEQMDSMRRILISIFIVMIFAISGIAYRLSRKITKPILDLDKGAKVIGSGDLDYHLEVRTGDEIEDLANAFNKMTDDLKAYIENLKETTAAKERIESELQIASEIQASMLPRIFPPFPDRKEFDIYATMDPAREVGGDFYDFFFIGDDKLCFLIGDVSGKGVPASLFMVISKTLLKTEGLRGYSPDEILSRVNSILYPDNDTNMFVTIFCVILDAKTGEIQFANGGHNPPLIGKDGEDFEFIRVPEGSIVGPMPNMEYECKKLALKPNDVIFLYTDGVTEAMNPEGQLFSDERLRQCLSDLKGKDIEDIIHGVRSEIATFAQGASQSDDITMLALRYKGGTM